MGHTKKIKTPKINKRPRIQLMIKIAGMTLAVLLLVWLGIASYIRFHGLPDAVFDTKGVVADNYPNQQAIYIHDKSGDSIQLLTVPKPTSSGITVYFAGRSGRTPQIINQASSLQTVVAPAYPGYYGSSGTPSPEGVTETADAIMKYLLDNGYAQSDITVVGHSLGTLAALQVARDYPNVSRVILINPLYSPKAVCQDYYSIFCALVGNYASPARIAPQAQAKIRQYHTADDEYIPKWQSQALYDLIGSHDKRFYVIPGTHADFDTKAILEAQT